MNWTLPNIYLNSSSVNIKWQAKSGGQVSTVDTVWETYQQPLGSTYNCARLWVYTGGYTKQQNINLHNIYSIAKHWATNAREFKSSTNPLHKWGRACLNYPRTLLLSLQAWHILVYTCAVIYRSNRFVYIQYIHTQHIFNTCISIH